MKTIELSGRTFHLLGTAHVSQASIEEVEKEIESIHPDCVAIELDEKRLKNMEDPDSWKKMDIIKVLKNKMGFLMIANLVLAGYQKKMGEGAGVQPGDEMMAAIRKAKSLGIPQTMVDRPVEITLRRAWAKNSAFGKCKLLSELLATAFTSEDVTPEEIESLKVSSEMDSMMDGISSYLPAVKEVLIDERDFYLASKIWNSEGSNILAVLGAAHIAGVQAHLEKFSAGQETPNISDIENVPNAKPVAKIIGWTIPILIIALIIAGFVVGGIEKGKNLLSAWVIWNGALAGIGAIIAGAHPLTVIVSIIGAPLTSLCPLVGIGIVAGIVQAIVRKPQVQDMENLTKDATSVRGFYKNRILRILLIFLLSSLGSSAGTFISGANFIAIFAK